MAKDLLIKTALDVRRFNSHHSGSPLMCPINPQQAALGFGGPKAAISIKGTYDIDDDGFGNSVGISNDDFATYITLNDTDYFTLDDWSTYTGIIILRTGFCWVHLNAYGSLTLDGTNHKYMSSRIEQTSGWGGAVVDEIHNHGISLEGVTKTVALDSSALLAVTVGDVIYPNLAAQNPQVSSGAVDVRLDIMQFYTV